MAEFSKVVSERESLKTTVSEKDRIIAEKDAKIQAFEQAEAARTKATQRQETVDAILTGAQSSKREELDLIVAGMAAKGEIDLDNPNKADEIREKLAKKYPSYFGPSEGTPQQGVPGPQGLDVSGMRYEDMTPEMRASLSPEARKQVLGIRPKGAGKLRI